MDGSTFFPLLQLTYSVRMWDLSSADIHRTRELPFERSASTFIEIRASPLVAGVMQGASDIVTRGGEQMLSLEPYLYSSDPDEPEKKVRPY